MNGPRVRLSVRAELCVGCYACEVACKQEHELPEGPRLIRVRTTDGAPQSAGATVGWGPEGALVGRPWFVPETCRHCDDPACVAVCPTGAVARGPYRVAVDASLCTGCAACADACAYGVVQFDPRDGTLVLCDLCWSRVTAGLRPACVHHCPADVLALSMTEDPGPAGWDLITDERGDCS